MGLIESKIDLFLFDAELLTNQFAQFIREFCVPWYRRLLVVSGIDVDIMLFSVSFQAASPRVQVPYEISTFQREIPKIVDWY